MSHSGLSTHDFYSISRTKALKNIKVDRSEIHGLSYICLDYDNDKVSRKRMKKNRKGFKMLTCDIKKYPDVKRGKPVFELRRPPIVVL